MEQQISISPLVKDILFKRGYQSEAEIDSFLNPSYEQHLHDPFLLSGMQQAVERIQEAVTKKQRVVIYGDYDIDGITASAVLLETFENLGHEATSYIPDRFEEGYGINLDALKKIKKEDYDLVVTVDCGITSAKEIAWAMKNGLDIIVTDHHAVPELIPEAVAVINPKLPNDPYPFKDLAGVGVAFKLAQALQKATGKPEAGQEKWLLDLVALGTVCDVVSLVGENRVLAKYGLMVMHKTRRVGIRALAQVSQVPVDTIRSYHLGYVFGPRMNAAGRLEHAAKSLELMTTDDQAWAMQIAEELDALNHQRRSDQARIFAEATTQAEQYADDPILVLANADWSHGVVGIVASKLVEKYHKPALVMQILGDTTKGSARSCGDFNIVEALRSTGDLLIKAGGHHYAAGCTLKTDDIDKLRNALNSYFVEHGTTVYEPDALASDGQVEQLSDLNWELLESLEELEPFGNGNSKPVLLGHELKVADIRRVGAEQQHLKLTLIDEAGQSIGGIGFSLAEPHANLKVGQSVNVVFELARNDFNGRSDLQLILRHIV
jgi:single-stranded-DNA-specific exonuclease